MKSAVSITSNASFACKSCQEDISFPVDTPMLALACPHCGEKVSHPDRGKLATSQPIAAIMTALLLIFVGCLIVWFVENWQQDRGDSVVGSSAHGGNDNADVSEEALLKRSLGNDVSEVIKAFTDNSTPEERLKNVTSNKGVMDELRVYHPKKKDARKAPTYYLGQTTGISAHRWYEIFLMQRPQPAPLNIREYFAPRELRDTELVKQKTSLIEEARRIDGDNLSKPIRINAFFKEIDGKLKLDTSVFIQGKTRRLKNFTNYGKPGKSMMFRVVASESLSHRYRRDPSVRTYRFEDFAFPADFVILPVEVGSKLGNVLSRLNWQGKNWGRVHKTATVELEWSNEIPSTLGIKRLVCWESLDRGDEMEGVETASMGEPAPR